ncbi:MAG: Phosphoribosylglycinamide formyltransferase [Candidatus Dichloromethanomonas elyunquensis]|nr:MAG: Phosphoribosylglycinamide formyltransferase [Candidatus Dichloromethanomonas elyunquensis]
MKAAVLASGRGSNLQSLIDEWQGGSLPVELVGVGSDNINAQALVRAAKAGIPARAFLRENYSDKESHELDILNWLEELGVELLILAGYMRVLSPSFIRQAEYPVVNIHPSLLPAFPGLHAQKQALEYGVKVAGCTVHFVDEGMDTGPIILQQTVPVFDEDNVDTLSERILKVEHEIYPEAIRLIVFGKVKREGRKVTIYRHS